MQKAFKQIGRTPEPSTTVASLRARLAERCPAHQRLARVRPSIRLRLAFIVVRQPPTQTVGEIRRRMKVATPQHLPTQHAEEQLDLIQPRAVDRREMEHDTVTRIAQERTPLRPTLEVFFYQGKLAPPGHQAADLQTPVCVQVVHNPVVALPVRVIVQYVPQVSHPVATGAGLTQIPDYLARRHHERGQQRAGAMADVLEFAFFRLARLDQLRGVLPLKDLHTRFLVAAAYQSAFLVLLPGVDVQRTAVRSLGIEVGIVAVEPVHTAVWLEIGSVEKALNGRAADGPMVGLVDNRGSKIIKAPARGWLVMLFGLAAGQGDNLQPFVGGKSSGGDRSVGRLGGQQGRER